ncbi:MAG: uroporphyrinogen-III synthase [Neisseriaceae bacterium]|nr:uroporphyrinogen-III synthase [Neisseriaceae bacterium]
MNIPLVFHTRPALVAEALTLDLRMAGLAAHPFPVIELKAEADFPHQLNQAPDFDYLIFVSPSAVALAWPSLRANWQQRLNAKIDATGQTPGFRPPKLCCVGNSTAQALTKTWLAEPLLQQKIPLAPWPILTPILGNDSTALLGMPIFSMSQALFHKHVGILASERGSPDLMSTLQARGAIVTRLLAYRTYFVEPNWADFAATCFKSGGNVDGKPIVFFVVSSSQIAQRLINTVPPELKMAWLSTPMIVLHSRIQSLLQQAGATAVHLAAANNVAIVQTIVMLWRASLGLNRLQ